MAKTEKVPKAPKVAKAPKVTWRSAVERILSESDVPLSYKELAERAGKMLVKKGLTPENTVNALLTSLIKKEGEACSFEKVGRGVYQWKAVPTDL